MTTKLCVFLFEASDRFKMSDKSSDETVTFNENRKRRSRRTRKRKFHGNRFVSVQVDVDVAASEDTTATGELLPAAVEDEEVRQLSSSVVLDSCLCFYIDQYILCSKLQ